MIKKKIKFCAWKNQSTSPYDKDWVSACKGYSVIMDGLPIEYGYKYCPACGRKIKIEE